MCLTVRLSRGLSQVQRVMRLAVLVTRPPCRLAERDGIPGLSRNLWTDSGLGLSATRDEVLERLSTGSQTTLYCSIVCAWSCGNLSASGCSQKGFRYCENPKTQRNDTLQIISIFPT